MVKRTLSRKDGTAWPEAGVRSRDNFERLRLRLKESIPAIAPALAPSLMSRRDGSGSISDAWSMAQLRWLWPHLQILGFWKFLHGSGNDPRPRKAFRLRLRLKYLDGSGGSGQNVSAQAILGRLQPRIAGQEVRGSRDDAE